MLKPVAIFVGSFDPFTLGHLDLLERIAHLGFQPVVGVGVNPKKNYLLNVSQRVSLIQQSLPKDMQIVVEAFEGLATEFASKHRARCFVRGVRNSTDLTSELNMAWANEDLDPAFETVFLPACRMHLHCSSSLVREIYYSGGDLSKFVPQPVIKFLQQR